MHTLMTLAVAASLTMTGAAADHPADATTPGTGSPVAVSPAFDWDWRYDDPTCDGITITFPADLPESQQGVLEVNVRFSFGTLQYKLEGDAYRAAFPDGHAGATVVLPWSAFRNGTVPAEGEWQVEWVQVHGTNDHWTGEVRCGEPAGGTTPPVDPSDPVDPAPPVDPTDPADPVDPTDPTDPADPVDPTDPADPGGPMGPHGTTDPVDPADPADPGTGSAAGPATTEEVRSEVLADDASASQVLAATGVPAARAVVAGVVLVLLGSAAVLLRTRAGRT